MLDMAIDTGDQGFYVGQLVEILAFHPSEPLHKRYMPADWWVGKQAFIADTPPNYGHPDLGQALRVTAQKAGRTRQTWVYSRWVKAAYQQPQGLRQLINRYKQGDLCSNT